MTHFAAGRAADALHFTHAVRREVVVQQETVGAFHHSTVDDLLIELGTERAGGQRLRFTAGEDSRTVCRRNITRLNPDGTDVLGVAAVKTDALVEDHVAHGVPEDFVVIAFHHHGFLIALLFGNSLDEVGENLVKVLITSLFALEGFSHGIYFVIKFSVHAFADSLVVSFVAVFAFRVGGRHLSGKVQLSLALNLNMLFRKIQSFNHVVFGNLVHFAFHHHDVVHGSGHNHVDVGTFHIFNSGVYHEFAIDATHAHFGNRAFEGDVRDSDSGRSGQTGKAVGQEVLVTGNQGHYDLSLSVEVLREEGTDSAIDQTSDEDFILGRAGFAFEETAGETTHSAVFFLIFNLQRHEVGAFHSFFFTTYSS